MAKIRRFKVIKPDTVQYWEGRIFNLRKFNRPLTDEELERLRAGEEVAGEVLLAEAVFPCPGRSED